MFTAVKTEGEADVDPLTFRNLSGSGWLQVLVVAGIMMALYARVLTELASDWWTEPGASHGVLIPPLALYVAWLQRNRWLNRPAVPESRGLALVGFACLTYLAGILGNEFFLTRLSFVLLLAGLIWTYWGSARLRALSFPLVLLVTMIPPPRLVWNSLASPLQLLASDLATNVAQWFGVAIYRDGNIIQLAGISLGVAEACSGLHSLAALMIASLLLGYLQSKTVAVRVLLLLLSMPLAVAVNIVRVSGTAILADHWPEIAMGFYHSFSGWLVFVAGFGVLWLMALALQPLDRKLQRKK
jgi:exosortase